MTDAGRKGLGDKFTESVTPDSSKSTLDKAKEGVTDAGDKVARGAQPDDSKSTFQQVSDKSGRSKDNHTKDGGSAGGVADSLKHAVGMDK